MGRSYRWIRISGVWYVSREAAMHSVKVRVKQATFRHLGKQCRSAPAGFGTGMAKPPV